MKTQVTGPVSNRYIQSLRQLRMQPKGIDTLLSSISEFLKGPNREMVLETVYELKRIKMPTQKIPSLFRDYRFRHIGFGEFPTMIRGLGAGGATEQQVTGLFKDNNLYNRFIKDADLSVKVKEAFSANELEMLGEIFISTELGIQFRSFDHRDYFIAGMKKVISSKLESLLDCGFNSEEIISIFTILAIRIGKLTKIDYANVYNYLVPLLDTVSFLRDAEYSKEDVFLYLNSQEDILRISSEETAQAQPGLLEKLIKLGVTDIKSMISFQTGISNAGGSNYGFLKKAMFGRLEQLLDLLSLPPEKVLSIMENAFIGAGPHQDKELVVNLVDSIIGAVKKLEVVSLSDDELYSLLIATANTGFYKNFAYPCLPVLVKSKEDARELTASFSILEGDDEHGVRMSQLPKKLVRVMPRFLDPRYAAVNRFVEAAKQDVLICQNFCAAKDLPLHNKIELHLFWDQKEHYGRGEKKIHQKVRQILFNEFVSFERFFGHHDVKMIMQASWSFWFFSKGRSNSWKMRCCIITEALRGDDDSLLSQLLSFKNRSAAAGFLLDCRRYLRDKDNDRYNRVKLSVALRKAEKKHYAGGLLREITKKHNWNWHSKKTVEDAADLAGLEGEEKSRFIGIVSRFAESDEKRLYRYLRTHLRFSEQTGISFAEAFGFVEGLMKIPSRKKLRVLNIVNKAVSTLPKGRKLSDIREQYTAIPFDTICQCLCFVNGMGIDRLLGIFNTVFSAKKIRTNKNNKLNIRNALTNIYLSKSDNNIGAVGDLLKLVEAGFTKSQQGPFMDSLLWIESLSQFGDFIESVEEIAKGEDR
ncbi:MAG: hypothetical protein HQ564_00475 [Candidatus Saganbacteria bacterium]|nr:hypothetical protein [Candidatus Saganbacteria bacterium]